MLHAHPLTTIRTNQELRVDVNALFRLRPCVKAGTLTAFISKLGISQLCIHVCVFNPCGVSIQLPLNK